MRPNDCSGFGGRKNPKAVPSLIPGFEDADAYVFPTWRDAIAEAQKQIDWAYERRRQLFLAASRAGLSYREIGEVAGLSAAGVGKIIGRQRAKDSAALLDSPASGEREHDRRTDG